MTDLDLYTGLPREPVQIDPTGGRLVAWAQAAGAAHQLAQSLSKTSFVPRAFQGNAGDATAAIMLGDELGLKPLAALRSIYIISGTPAMYARTMVALVMSHGHEVWTESSTDREVVVCGRRRGSEHVERSAWTIDRARKAGYTNNKKYDSDPQAMLYAKAAGEVARKVAPDVLAGVPFSVEDLELEPENQPKTTVARTTRVARPKPQPVEPEFDDMPNHDRPLGTPETADRPQSPVTVPAERGEPAISDAQSKKLHALLREVGITDRAIGLSYIGELIGREIQSSKELTRTEASKAIDQIETEREPAEPEFEPALPGVDQ
jgi:hypothetical protein